MIVEAQKEFSLPIVKKGEMRNYKVAFTCLLSMQNSAMIWSVLEDWLQGLNYSELKEVSNYEPESQKEEDIPFLVWLANKSNKIFREQGEVELIKIVLYDMQTEEVLAYSPEPQVGE